MPIQATGVQKRGPGEPPQERGQRERFRAWAWSACCVAILGATMLAALAGTAPRSAEKWAAPGLKVIRGLELWLDAGRQNAARRALGQPEIKPGQPVDTWYDASGQGRHLIQKDVQARPTLTVQGNHIAVRFDGRRQHFSLPGLGRSFKEVTVFVVAVPFSNRGDFRGFVALNRAGVNDYSSGLTLDQGFASSPRFQSLNPEGAGFGGAVNLLKDAFDFGTVQRLTVTSAVGPGGTKLYLNGKLQGARDRADSVLHMDRVTVGARFYTNGGPPQVRGFLEGDILEVLVYSRALDDDERRAVDGYLRARHGSLRTVALPARADGGRRLVSVPNPPPVQMLVPGFTVRQLPVDLTNINNVRYRADGKLVALAYSGDVYLLSDSDGDGLEDRVEKFWDNKGRLRAPIGMDLTPPGYGHGQGVFVASKGKCSLLVDTDGDGRADREIVLAQGWQELPHGVDALGVALDPKDGSVYFGLGTADYGNAYQLDKAGKAHYRLGSERGTILRISPDFKRREIFCTGIRFPVGLAFNRAGDLFCTDQEGATWLPNGNPLDELLHIQKGRHYGFPPRHPRHLPDVIDEPSVFDYAPQHQSTCGLQFNEPVNGGPVFGPARWRSDALVCGYSRGKLYRTQLVRTESGYVARTQLLAALNMLACDACVSPQGDLVIAVHGGGPDWGSGPLGKGRLYKVSYTGKTLPQPVLAWAHAPREVRIAFDRPVDPEHLRGLASRVGIEYGLHVAPGDRFEHLRPGYQVVQDQLEAPRYTLPVLNLALTPDRRTVILATAPHPSALRYAVTLPGLGRPTKPAARELPQAPETDLGYDLSGVEAVWQPTGGASAWTGWLPHLDLAVARAFTRGSATHDKLWAGAREPGTLTLRTQLNLWHMLRPAVQPGSKLDHEPPPERVTLTFRAREKLEVRGAKTEPVGADKSGRPGLRLTVSPAADRPLPLELVVHAAAAGPDLTVSYHTHEDPRPRALPLHRLLLPWAAAAKEAAPTAVARAVPELEGGSWLRGRAVFFSDQAACAKCHTVNGAGGRIGPDLSNLPHRDYHSVLRDITQPSFAINPDFITHIVELKDGRVLTGTLRTEGERVEVGDAEGNVTTVARADVERMRTAAQSVMPEGLPKLLGPQRLRDLMTFLLTEPPRMPEYGKGPPPKPRSRKEVQAALAGAPPAPAKPRPLHILLVAGKKDHGLGEHDYPAWQKVWQRLLGMAEGVKVATAWEWPAAEDFRSADVLVFYQHGSWDAKRARDIDGFLARGGGLVYIHYAVDGRGDAEGFARRIGLSWGAGARYRHGPLDVQFSRGSDHPIARNFDKVHFHDESYWRLVGDPKKVQVLASGLEEGRPQPLFWARAEGKGRVFVSIPGHYAWTFDDPLFRLLLLRGLAWAAREPVDRFNELVLPGARVKD
jgi:putative heme-binding domain-containing protein